MRQIRLIVSLTLLCLLSLDCTSKEDRARALHEQSLDANISGNAPLHEELLERIVADYPSTLTSAKAAEELKALRFNREVLFSKTVGVVRTILAGQALFLTANGRYALSLDELCNSKRGGFDCEFLNPEKGYQYEMTATKGTYVVSVTPTLPTLKKHFLADNTGSIHEEVSKPATLESPLTDY
jgi:hypothetical protein